MLRDFVIILFWFDNHKVGIGIRLPIGKPYKVGIGIIKNYWNLILVCDLFVVENGCGFA